MVEVRLARGWTDSGGADHQPGDLVDVDAITLAQLETCGVVTPSEALEPPTYPPTERGPDPPPTGRLSRPAGAAPRDR